MHCSTSPKWEKHSVSLFAIHVRVCQTLSLCPMVNWTYVLQVMWSECPTVIFLYRLEHLVHSSSGMLRTGQGSGWFACKFYSICSLYLDPFITINKNINSLIKANISMDNVYILLIFHRRTLSP